jgi:cytochrome oxidase Cu insertion factor (SCO1/SenC/PrrC family)
MRKSPQYFKLGIFFLMLLISTLLAACSNTAPTAAPVSFQNVVPNGKVSKGTAVPNFTATDINGKTFQLSDFKGKAVLVNFWTTW